MVLSTFHDQLVCSRNQVEGIHMMKFIRHSFSKEISSTPRTHLPCPGNIFRVGPDEVTESSLMGDFLIAIYGSDLVQRSHIRRQASVDAQDLFVNQCSKAETIKALYTMSPHGCIPVFAKAFIVEAVDLCNLPTLEE